jgi:hypothetical protein
MDRIRDLCDLARDVDESLESLIRFGASGELAIYVIAHDWSVRSKADAENTIRGPVFLVAEDLHQSLNAECTTVSRVKRRINDDPIMLLEPLVVERGAHFVTAEEAERFSREHALTLKSSTETPSYLNLHHDFYSTELAIAVKAWVALFADGSFEPGNRTPRQKIVRWLRASKFGLKANAEQRIATLVNPDPAKVGGAPRTLTK